MKRRKNDCDLQSCSLCKGCLKEWLPALNANRKTFEFKKGETIFKEGDPVRGIYFLVSGKAKIHKKWGEDKELIVRFAGAGDVVGHRGLGKESFFPVSGTALEPVSACFVDLDFFMASLKVNHDFTLKFLLFFAEELQESERNMRNLGQMQVRERVADVLLRLKEKFGLSTEMELNIPISRHDLASFAGTTYESVFRVLTEFGNDGMINISGKGIFILNAILLRKLISKNKV